MDRPHNRLLGVGTKEQWTNSALPTGVGDGFCAKRAQRYAGGHRQVWNLPTAVRIYQALNLPPVQRLRPPARLSLVDTVTEDLSSLLARARGGQRTAQRALYDRFAGRVYATCRRYAPDADTAYDFAQEAWLTAFAKLDAYREEGNFEGWLRRLTARRCIDLLRRRGLRTEELPAVLPKGAQLEPDVLHRLAAEELLRYVEQLPEGYRLVFNLVAVEGLNHAEVASALGISESSSRSQLTRARRTLQRKLANIITLCL